MDDRLTNDDRDVPDLQSRRRFHEDSGVERRQLAHVRRRKRLVLGTPRFMDQLDTRVIDLALDIGELVVSHCWLIHESVPDVVDHRTILEFGDARLGYRPR